MDSLLLALFFNWLAVVYLIVIVALIVLHKTAGVFTSVTISALVMAALALTFLRSGRSGVAIEFFTLPTVGAVAGFVGLLFGRWRSSPDSLQRVVAWGLLAIVVIYVLALLWRGITNADAREMRERRSRYEAAGLAIARERIGDGLARHPDAQAAWLDSVILAKINQRDRAFILAALENDSVSAGVLDTLAKGTDSTIVLAVARHPNTGAETLTRIYRTGTQRGYFAAALASNRHTPKDVLREIAATTKDPVVIRSMLHNQALDCNLLKRLEATLEAMPRDSTGRGPFASEAALLKEIKPKICGGSSSPTP